MPNPNLAPANTGHTLTLIKGDIANQAKLAFNPVAGVTSRGAGSSRGANRGALSTSVSSAPLRIFPVSPTGLERSLGRTGVGVAPAHGDFRAPASPVVTWSRTDPGSWRLRSPAALREPRVRRDGDRVYMDYSHILGGLLHATDHLLAALRDLLDGGHLVVLLLTLSSLPGLREEISQRLAHLGIILLEFR